MNDARTNASSCAKDVPTRYELIDKDGDPVILKSHDGSMVRRLTFDTAVGAAEHARHLWPDQEQDEERSGKGWDIQLAGCDR